MGRWLLWASLVGCGRFGFGSGDSDASIGNSDGTRLDAHDAAIDTALDALPAALVAWYPFDDELADMVTTDFTGQHHATCAGPCPATTTGHIGAAFNSFQSVATGGLEVLDHVELRVAPMTVAVWVRWESGGGFASAVAKPFGAGTSNSFQLDVDDTGVPRFSTYDGNNTTRIQGPTLTASTWTHLAGTHEGTRMRFYVNGSEVAMSNALVPAWDAQSIFLGADRNNG